ncbi:hypothetical protein PTKIN_Ptkin03bG0104600 [Pterospermum kingtungense]
MAPTSKKGKTRRKASKPRRSDHHKKKVVKPNISIQKPLAVLEDLPSNSEYHFEMDGFDNDSPCSTPKAQRFRIPEINTCPPAPKKQRVLSNCLLKTTPITFFAPPDLELFFFFALKDISV